MIELKTVYGWENANMALISDARLHTHVIIGSKYIIVSL